MRLLEFVGHYQGDSVRSPAGLGGQCVDLVNQYLIDVWHQAEVRANAADWAKVQLQGWTWVANGRTNYAPVGAIVVWGAHGPHGIGSFGHIAVCILADPMALLTFDQDWPFGALCALTLHDYGGVAGWFAR